MAARANESIIDAVHEPAGSGPPAESMEASGIGPDAVVRTARDPVK